MDRFARELLEKTEAIQRELTPEQRENKIWSWYDKLWGGLNGAVGDLYARVSLIEVLDNLFGTALLTIPSYTKERAETADVKITSAAGPGGASTASFIQRSGGSAVSTSRDPSYSPGDEDAGHR